MATWPYPTTYPVALDNFSTAQIDGTDIVWANHPNSLASALMAVQAKLNTTNAQIQDTGGIAFDPTGHAANPAAAGVPSFWVDNTTAPGFAPMYTDEIGNSYDLRGGSGGGFVSQYVYCDATDGDDATGDGTPGKPYKTWAAACAAQAAPTTVAIFSTPLEFILAPGGDYPGPVTVPKRLHVTVQGDDCSISGTINWGIDPKVWSDLGLATSNVPVLEFARTPPVPGVEANTSPFAPYSQGFQLVAGHLEVYNSNTGTALPMPDYHVVSLTGVMRDGFGIYNKPAGTAVPLDAPGTMNLYLTDSPTTAGSPSIIAGEADSDGMVLYENAVMIRALRSYVTMHGVCRIGQLDQCVYWADRTLDYAGGAYSYGKISAEPGFGGFPDGTIRNSLMVVDSTMGTDPVAVPAYSDACAIIFDRDSLLSMLAVCADLAVTFGGFATDVTGAYERGWWFGTDEALGDHAIVRIPCAGAEDSYRLLLHAYGTAKNWLPLGAALSATNRVTLLLEPGWYEATTKGTPDFEMRHDYVDIVATSGLSGYEKTAAYAPPVHIHLNGTNFIVTTAMARLEGIDLVQSKSTPPASCMVVADTVRDVFFKNLSWSEDPSGAGSVLAVTIDPLFVGYVAGIWEDCHTNLDGFLYGGSIRPTMMRRCSGGHFSFAAWSGDTVLNVACLGVLEDCEGRNNCFAAVGCTNGTGGGNAYFNATATRCKVASTGFGSALSLTPGEVYTGECKGILTDCHNLKSGGLRSFGYSYTGDGTASGVFVRCTAGDNSFGASDAATGYGSFTGTAEYCGAGKCSFGGNETDPEYSVFMGYATHCSAEHWSFGARGNNEGIAIDCVASGGSFGDQQTQANARMERCRVEDIEVSMIGDRGPPRVFGALLVDCHFFVSPGEDIAPLMLNGGSGPSATRIYGCRFYTDTHLTSIDSSVGAVDAQIAHCEMNVDISTDVENIITSDPYNVVNENYNPTPDWPH